MLCAGISSLKYTFLFLSVLGFCWIPTDNNDTRRVAPTFERCSYVSPIAFRS